MLSEISAISPPDEPKEESWTVSSLAHLHSGLLAKSSGPTNTPVQFDYRGTKAVFGNSAPTRVNIEPDNAQLLNS
jgi:hypothetical protein